MQKPLFCFPLLNPHSTVPGISRYMCPFQPAAVFTLNSTGLGFLRVGCVLIQLYAFTVICSWMNERSEID